MNVSEVDLSKIKAGTSWVRGLSAGESALTLYELFNSYSHRYSALYRDKFDQRLLGELVEYDGLFKRYNRCFRSVDEQACVDYGIKHVPYWYWVSCV